MASEPTRFGGGLTVNFAQFSFQYGVMFAEQDKNAIRRALPAWVNVVEIKEFPNAPKKSAG